MEPNTDNTSKKDKENIWKNIFIITLIVIGLALAFSNRYVPCKIVLSLMPEIELCKPDTYVVVSVRADMAWQNTGIFIQSGQTLNVVASGSVNTWDNKPESYSPGPDGHTQDTTCPSEGNIPDCLINGEWYGTLIGRVGENGTPFRIGAKNTLPMTESGYLYLAINDDEPYFSDNTGSYSVSISVK